MIMQRRELTRCLKALANERRVRILEELLGSMPLTVDALARRIKLSYQATSKHVAQLERCDLVDRTRQSLEVYYRVNRQHPVLRAILTHFRTK